MNDFDPIPLCKMIKESIGGETFILFVLDATGAVRQFANCTPESQLVVMKQCIEQLEDFVSGLDNAEFAEDFSKLH
jgi:hypothetical protein